MTYPLLTFRAEDRVIHGLDLLVSITEQSYQHHLNRALSLYVKTEIDSLQEIAESIVRADADNLPSHDAVATPLHRHFHR